MNLDDSCGSCIFVGQRARKIAVKDTNPPSLYGDKKERDSFASDANSEKKTDDDPDDPFESLTARFQALRESYKREPSVVKNDRMIGNGLVYEQPAKYRPYSSVSTGSQASNFYY